MLLLFALIALDLWDSSCYALDVARPDPAISAHEAGQSDAGANFCVSDCFCCSSAPPAVTIALAQEPTAVSDIPTFPVRSLAEGFSSLLDHVPIFAA